MVPWIEYLPCKHEELSSNLCLTPMKKVGVAVLIYNPNVGREEADKDASQNLLLTSWASQ